MKEKMSEHKKKRPSSSSNPVTRAIQFDWMVQAVEHGDPDNMVECWHCHQWRPEKPGNENEKCPHCGAVYVPF
jgi:uncharacterized paraquat-inducible protein A